MAPNLRGWARRRGARGDGAGRVSVARRALLSAVWSPRPCSCNCAGLRRSRARPRTARAASSFPPPHRPPSPSLPRARGHPRRQSLMQSLTRFSLPFLTYSRLSLHSLFKMKGTSMPHSFHSHKPNKIGDVDEFFLPRSFQNNDTTAIYATMLQKNCHIDLRSNEIYCNLS